MIKKILILFTITVLLAVSTTPALAQKPPDENGKGISADGTHGNGNVNNDHGANGNSDNKQQGKPTDNNPPAINPTITTIKQEVSAPDIRNPHSIIARGRARFTADKNLSHGFDDSGYNRTARIFNGTAWDWCMEKVGDEAWCQDYLGESANDHLIMKWNAEWDRGNVDGWNKPPYDAWENNQWNGKVPGGSGDVWHYKIVWVGPCTDGKNVPEGGYCIWGQFAVIMDQGTMDGVHYWFAHGMPTGYGSYP